MKFLKFLKSKKIKRYLILNKSLITIFAISLSILSLFLISNFINQNQVKTSSKANTNTQQTLLQGGFEIGVISLNLDKDVDMNGRGDVSGARPLKEMISESLSEGKKWDIIGFQEIIERPGSNYSDTQLFKNLMKELLPERNYNCVVQTSKRGTGFYNAICTWYPIVDGSYKEAVIWQSETAERLVQCVQIQSPAGILPFCNTHPRAYPNTQQPAADQFRNMQNIVFNNILPQYIPQNISVEQRQIYNFSLRARLLLTGDMNADTNLIQGKFISACKDNWKGNSIPQNTFCGIDNVMFANMEHSEFAHQSPFNVQYLNSEGGYRDTTRQWPTDHQGPVLALISTRELKLNLSDSQNPNPTPTPVNTLPPPAGTVPSGLNSLNGKPIIKIANFNPGSGHAGNQPRVNAWSELYRAMTENKVEILMLQEPVRQELDKIKEIFTPYFPYSTQIISRGGGELNPVFSKYPFISGTQQEWRISPSDPDHDKGRVALSVEVLTPYGPLRIVNVHTHGNTQCADAYKAMEPIINPQSPYYNAPSKNFIIAGDFNIAFKQILPAYSPNIPNSGAILEGDFCDNSEYSNQFIDKQVLADMLRPNYKAYCLDETNCINRRTIEMVLTLNNNPIEIYKTYWSEEKFRDIFEDRNRHPLVIAEIGNPNWIMPTSPPTPVSLGASISQENSNTFVAEWNDNRGSKYLNLTKCIDTFCNNNNSFVRITPCPNPTQIGLANNDTDASSSTSKWCKYLINSDSSSNGQKRTKRFTFNLSTLGSGNYIFALSQEVSDTLRCSGNPACEENNGTSGSCGFSSCHSTTDFVKFNTETSITTPTVGNTTSPATPSPTSLVPTNTVSPTNTLTPTHTPTNTPTPMPTNTPTNTPTPMPTNTPTNTPTPRIENVTLKISFKIQGVNTKPKQTQTLRARVFLQAENDSQSREKSVTFLSNSNGVFTQNINFDEVNFGKKYKVGIKPDKHLKTQFCENTINSITPNFYTCNLFGIQPSREMVLDYTQVIILSGDVFPQNGVADSYDIAYVRNNIGITDEDIVNKADINLDGVIDTQDYLLVLGGLIQRSDQ